MGSGRRETGQSHSALSYWDVLEQMHGRLENDEAPEPVLDGDEPSGFSRREMLKFMGASVALAGLSSCRRPVETILPYVDPPERMIPGVPRYYASTMPLGHSAYGVVVKSVDGRPIKIEGNPRHPSTGGASNVLMQAAILSLYDPDRSHAVHHGNDEKTWDEFVTAWQTVDAAELQSGGAGLAVLSEPFSSPTLARLKSGFEARFPRARWVSFDPTSDENVYEGIGLATGQVYEPAWVIERAKVILALDSDFLSTDTENVANARGFAQGRRVQSSSDSMSRLYVAESGYSLTGANADHRLPVRSAEIGSLLLALIGALRKHGVAVDAPARASSGLAGVDPHWIDVAAKDLASHRSEGLVIVGSHQPPEVHALAMAVNGALGNIGRTIVLRDLPDVSRSSLGQLRSLVAAMGNGQISTLVILGGNPVYNAPADLNFEGALAKVGTVIHLSQQVNETSRLAHWRLPEAHFLEAWGDARAVDGTMSVIQPLIRPLYDGKSAIEVLSLMSGEAGVSGHDQVRATWSPMLGDLELDKRWNRTLHDGLLADSGVPPVAATIQGAALAGTVLPGTASADGTMEIVFRRSPTVHDGRFANNGWLQELPDPITKLTWDNVAVVSPKTAADHGLSNEDQVRIHYRDRSVETPVWIVPGHADDSISVTLGYGRRSGGRVADEVGVDMYPLRTSGAPGFDTGARIEKTGTKVPLASTQNHSTMDGRELVIEASMDHYRSHPEFAHGHEAHASGAGIFEDPVSWEGQQWGMTIDLSTCIGCNGCVIACQSENNVPVVGKRQVSLGREMHWIRIDRYFTDSEPASQHAAEIVFQPMPCQHCETAPCEQVCPVAATVHDSEGLNVMVYNRCIGTRYCSNNCPYKVRRFNYFDLTRHLPEVVKLAQNPDVTVRSRGVMEKCSFCLQRISAAKIEAKKERRGLRDGEVRTACQQSCPTQAIEFGRIDDANSAVAQRKANERNYELLGHLNTRPRVSYLAKLRNPHPELTGGDEAGH